MIGSDVTTAGIWISPFPPPGKKKGLLMLAPVVTGTDVVLASLFI